MQSIEHEEPLPPGYPSIRCVHTSVFCVLRQIRTRDRNAHLQLNLLWLRLVLVFAHNNSQTSHHDDGVPLTLVLELARVCRADTLSRPDIWCQCLINQLVGGVTAVSTIDHIMAKHHAFRARP